MISATDDTFKDLVLNAKSLVVVDFHADWCIPCKQVIPILEKLIKEGFDVKIVSVDTSACSKTASSFNILSVPTLVFIKDGGEVARYVGVIPYQALLALVKKHA